MTLPDTIRRNLVEHVALLANADAQLRYEREVSHVPAYMELIESFFDSYIPGDSAFEQAFSREEKRCLAEVGRKLESLPLDGIHAVSQLLATEEWRDVMRHAHEAATILTQNA